MLTTKLILLLGSRPRSVTVGLTVTTPVHSSGFGLHVPTIELLDDTVESVEVLAAIGRDLFKEDHAPTCAGLLGTSGQAEIDQDVRRLKDAGLITEKVAQYVTYVECDLYHMSAHDTARDAERLLIRLIGIDNLLNNRNGGAGRVPKDTRIGGVFI